MNTQAMPALASALAGVLPQNAVRSLMQALGNCNQAVTQRGSVRVQNDRRLRNGVETGRTWNEQDYTNIMPYAGKIEPSQNQRRTVLPKTPTNSPGDWNSATYNSYFSFPTNVEFNEGDSVFNNINNTYGGNSYFESVTVNNITYVGGGGGGGTPGRDGRDGRDGAPGPPGAPGAPGGGGGGRGGGGIILPLVPFEVIRYVSDVRKPKWYPVRKRLKLEVEGSGDFLHYRFNPDTCENEELRTPLGLGELKIETDDANTGDGPLVVVDGWILSQVDYAFAKVLR